MARKSIHTFPTLWRKHEQIYLSIFREAVRRLNISQAQRENEDAISESLCPILRSVCFEHKDDIRVPAWEKRIPPATKEELKCREFGKRPDFSCELVNPYANSADLYEISFHVECKRLGESKPSWNINKNYLMNGIVRFDSHSHQYGKGAPSGLMIGYMVSMSPEEILVKVNKAIKKHQNNLHPLEFNFNEHISECEQTLTRLVVKPDQFKLIHIWADLTE